MLTTGLLSLVLGLFSPTTSKSFKALICFSYSWPMF